MKKRLLLNAGVLLFLSHREGGFCNFQYSKTTVSVKFRDKDNYLKNDVTELTDELQSNDRKSFMKKRLMDCFIWIKSLTCAKDNELGSPDSSREADAMPAAKDEKESDVPPNEVSDLKQNEIRS